MWGSAATSPEPAAAVIRSVRSIQAAMTPWAARQMYLNFAETSRDPASFWDPQAYSRLRRVKAALDPRGPVPVQPSHPARHHPLTYTDTRKNDQSQPHHHHLHQLLAPPPSPPPLPPLIP